MVLHQPRDASIIRPVASPRSAANIPAHGPRGRRRVMDGLDDERLMNCFDYQPRTRLVFGNGEAERVGALARELGGQRVLLVTDAGLVSAGHADRVRRS